MYQYADLEYKIIELIKNNTLKATLGYAQGGKFILGGSSGPNGGSGGPWQQPVGQLPQTLVCYDTTEAAVPGFVGSGMSLLDNLNHIRGGYTIYPDYVPNNYIVASGANLINHLAGIDAVLASGGSFPGYGSGVANVDVSPASPGSSSLVARADHKHYLDEAIVPTWTGKHLWRPSSDAIDVLKVVNNANTVTVLQVDTQNKRVGIGGAPSYPLHIQMTSYGDAIVVTDMGGKEAIVLDAHVPNLTLYSDLSNAYVSIETNGGGRAWLQFMDRSGNYGWRWTHKGSGSNYRMVMSYSSGLWIDRHSFSYVGAGFGIGDADPQAILQALGTTEQLRLNYDSSNYVSFIVGSNSTLTISPAASGGITIKPTTDTSSAFRVQNAAGTSFLTCDTSTPRLTLSSATSSIAQVINQSSSAISGSMTSLQINQTLSQTGTGSASQAPLLIVAEKTDSYTSSGWSYMIDARYYNKGNGGIGPTIGVRSYVMNNGSGTASSLTGLSAVIGADVTGASGTITTGAGVVSSPTTKGTASIGTFYGFWSRALGLVANSVITAYAFKADAFAGKAATIYAFHAADGHAVFNEDGGDYDFRVEGDTDANLLFIDASVDRVGVGQSAPAAKLHVSGGARVDRSTAGSALYIEQSDSSTWSCSAYIRNSASSGNVEAGILRVETAQGDSSTLVMTNWVNSVKTLAQVRGDGRLWLYNLLQIGGTPDSPLSSYKLDCRGAGHFGSTAGPTYPASGTDIISGYDGIGGFRIWNYDGVDGTARVLINDAAGDVQYVLYVLGVLRTSGGTRSEFAASCTPGSTAVLWDNGVDRLVLTVTTGGQAYLQRTLGSMTFKVSLLGLWL